jgi:ABC-type phosphate transport system auxiliary subunit
VIDVLIVLGVFAIVIYLGWVAFLAVNFYKVTTKFEAAAKRRVAAKANPYKSIDIQFMVDAGMTPEQIEQAVRNAIDRKMR